MQPIAILGTLAALAMGTAMPATFPQAAPRALQPEDTGYRPLLETATTPLREAFGDRVVVEVERLDCLGRWAFLQGSMRTPGGQRPDFRGTEYAERAAAGSMSDVYVALLRHDPPPRDGTGGDGNADGDPDAAAATDADGAGAGAAPADPGSAATDAACADAPGDWVVLDHAIGPGDVAWLTWPQEHAAPRAVFGF